MEHKKYIKMLRNKACIFIQKLQFFGSIDSKIAVKYPRRYIIYKLENNSLVVRYFGFRCDGK